jgi:two-component system, sensor histidine kinase and response regulator
MDTRFSLRIMMVEDSKHDFQLSKRTLEKSDLDCDITWAQRGEAALVHLQEEPFDVMTLDFKLPGMDGITTFREVRAAGLSIPIVFMTGSGNEQIAVEAMKMGAQDYLVKDPQGLYLELLSTVIRKAYQQRENEKARQQAEADRERLIIELDAFAHTVAHDLKNPLNVVIGYTSLLLDTLDELPLEEIKSFLSSLHAGGLKMNSIIDELLLLASVRKLDEIKCVPLDMRHIVTEAQSRLVLMVEQYQANIVLMDAENWPIALGYASWVEEIWANYISNAIKYGGTPPRIEIGATLRENNMIQFWVQDNGRGISPAEQARLFGQFTRLDETRAQGHGLGLSIVKRIAEKLAGGVGVTSSVGQGSVFNFTLPSIPKEHSE